MELVAWRELLQHAHRARLNELLLATEMAEIVPSEANDTPQMIRGKQLGMTIFNRGPKNRKIYGR